jgi:acetyl esterase/lipase
VTRRSKHRLYGTRGAFATKPRRPALQTLKLLFADDTTGVRRIAVAGDSAGANMAAVTALRVRDEGGPPLCGQLLLYPVTDYHTPGTPSYKENAEGSGLTRDTMKWF